MAGKKAEKPKKEKSGKGGGLMGLLSKVFAILAILSLAALFAIALDIGHMDLAHSLGTLTAAPLGLYVVSALAALFLAPKPKAAGSADADSDDLPPAFKEFQSKINSHVLKLQDNVDELASHQNTESPQDVLMAENQALKEELEAIHAERREKANEQLETLRERNEELEKKIQEWAQQAVASAVNGEAAEPMQAA